MKFPIRTLVVTILVALSSLTAADADSASRTLMFDVFLDGKKIGYHRFDIDGTRSNAAVRSEASFDVKLFFVTAFSYRHTATESWSNGCLDEIEARTDSNGKMLNVVGERTGNGFVIDTGEREAELPKCVMSFAYWNPGFLEQPRLLNPQTGEYVDVEVQDLGNDVLRIDGREIPARSVRLTARKMDIRLWYSEESEWLALESVAKGGRIIRYELS
jgi:RNase P/RNase MRP subunit p29